MALQMLQKSHATLPPTSLQGVVFTKINRDLSLQNIQHAYQSDHGKNVETAEALQLTQPHPRGAVAAAGVKQVLPF
jgi:hypothetical protein